MKSYTDIKQSKKLAEILPLKSADMCYRIVAYNPNDTHEYQPYCFVGTLESDIPCWSLAALLGQMICPKLENYVGNSWDLEAAMDDTLQRWLSVQDCPTAVDACVEMFIKLHEQNIKKNINFLEDKEIDIGLSKNLKGPNPPIYL